MGEVKLACYTGPWGPSGLIQAITDISDCGFEGLEVPAAIVGRYEDRLHVFEEILDTSALSLSGMLQKVNLLDRERADEQVERAVNTARFVGATGCENLVITHDGPVVERMTDEDWATVAAILEEIGTRCDEFGVGLCFLPRAHNLVSTEKDIKRLLAMTDPRFVGLSVDTAETILSGGNPARLVKQHIERILTVRYHDVSGSKRRAKTTSDRPGSTPQFGRGVADFEAVSKALLTSGYSGWVTLDVSGEDHEPLDAISQGFRFLMRKSGLFSI